MVLAMGAVVGFTLATILKQEDPAADHYFGWVQSSGWEYVIPRNPAAQPVQLVYVGLQTTQDGNATRPASPVAGTCPLVAAR